MDYSNLKVLVVDDDMGTLQLISTLLFHEFNLNVRTATSAKEAFDMMNEDKPDLLILDMQMPVMDGYTAIVHIRSDVILKDISIIPCTALNHKDLILSLRRLNIQDYIVKPIIRKTFFAKIGNELNNITMKKNLKEL
jgi:two-component system sensor histidine kinase/response regulator